MKAKILLMLCIFIFISTLVFAGTNAKALYRQADKLYLQGDYKMALEYCRSLLKDFKRSSLKDDTNLLAGLSLLKLARYSQARDYFNAVIAQRPKSALQEEAYLGLADSYFLEKDYAKSRDLYYEILSSFPDTDFSGIINSRLEEMGGSKAKTSKQASSYTVQVGSFKRRSNAKKLYTKFRKRGYSAYIVESKKGTRRLYKVRIGKFKSEKEAQDFTRKLKKQGYETKVCAY